jgi:hypothetical protein
MYVRDRVWYHMTACKILSSFIIKDVRKNVRNSSARNCAVPKWEVGDLVWCQMKACKILSSYIIQGRLEKVFGTLVLGSARF